MVISEIYEIYLSCKMQVSTDTRNITQGSLFFALKGENFNGNLFAEQALEKGAAFAVVDEKLQENDRFIVVENALKTMQELASLHRTVVAPRVIGIGGSNGKTTTKELLVSILSTEYRVLSTKGNFNNQIGLPLTLLELRNQDQIAVIEMGANKVGDIQELCSIALPELGLITNIGKEHLEGFGSIEGVAKAESELFDYLIKNNGHAFVNVDDMWLNNMGKRIENKSEYGYSIVHDDNRVINPEIKFNYKGISVHSVLMGTYNMQNILAAISVAEFFHIKPENIARGIEAYIPQNNRSQWVHSAKSNNVLLDAYNANPSSVEVALQAFSEIKGDKVVMLGDMFELGQFEASEHQSIADLCATLPFNQVYLIGKAFNSVTLNKDTIQKFQDKISAKEIIEKANYSHTNFLIKGSRGMNMEELLELL